ALKALLSAQSAQIDAFGQERAQWVVERETLRQGTHDDKQEIARLGLLLDKLRRMLFGQKSERLVAQIDQLQLELEELHINQGGRAEKIESTQASAARAAPPRRPLPEHLPREVHEHLPKESACPDCGGAWQRLGEDVSEVLEHIPASFRIVRHVRPRLACRCCDRMAQASAPSRPIARSLAGPGLLSHVMVSKYLDHQPLYRQCQIYEREHVNLAQSTVGDWVGGVHELLRPLIDALRRHVFTADKLHTDDTPIKVLAPGTGRTREARLWVYARDDRPSGDTTAPAMWMRYSPDRRGIHPQTHLKDYMGILQADAFAGYNKVYESGRVVEAGCWAHARRKFYDVHVKDATPITTYVLERIAELYKIESSIRGSPPDVRQGARQEHAKPIVTALYAWLREQLPTVSRKSKTADAITYAMNQWQALTRYLDDGRIEIDNNAAERALRGVALGRKNYLFLGSDAGGERAATMYSLLGTAKLNDINPQAYLRHVLTVIADHPVNRIDELLPWNVGKHALSLDRAA
ncbi:IS66 family transposase, partial [Achromobacter pulmonis]